MMSGQGHGGDCQTHADTHTDNDNGNGDGEDPWTGRERQRGRADLWAGGRRPVPVPGPVPWQAGGCPTGPQTLEAMLEGLWDRPISDPPPWILSPGF